MISCHVNFSVWGSGCDSVGRAVASFTWGPRFESSHQQKINITFVHCQLYWKDENKEKEAGQGPFFKKKIRVKIVMLTFVSNKKAYFI